MLAFHDHLGDMAISGPIFGRGVALGQYSADVLKLSKVRAIHAPPLPPPLIKIMMSVMSAMSRRPTAIVGSSDCVKSDGISSSGMSSEGVSYDVVSYEGVSYDGVSYGGVTGVCNTAVIRRWKFGRRELGRCYTRMFNGVSIDGGSSNGGKFRRREILFPTAENSTSEGGKFDFRRRKHRCCGDC